MHTPLLRSRSITSCLTALVIASALTACGFSDTLTSRGFIAEGDQVCVDTLVKTGLGLSSQRGVTGSEFLSALASAYGRAAARFRRLDIRSDDEAMRDRVANRYSSFSRRLQVASLDAAAGTNPPAARVVFSEISALQRQMKDYGFVVCGGGGAPGSSQR
jgi:hypothetical protein